MCAAGACGWVVNYMPRRCWRARLIRVLPSAVLDFPFSVMLAVLTSVYGPTALFGSPIGAIKFMPDPFEHIWGFVVTVGSVIIWAALYRGRIGTWLPNGLWICSVSLLAYVALVLSTLNLDDYAARTVFSAVTGVIGIVQAFKLQTGHMWAVAAIRDARKEGPDGGDG